MAPNTGLTLDAPVISVRSLMPNSVGDAVRLRYEETFGNPPEHPGGWYRPDDWRRTSFALELLQPGAEVLDVGAGAGQFANMLAASGKFGSVTALDHTRFGKYSEFHDTITRVDASIVELPFDDDHFEVVTCMEVLEHVPDEVFLPGIAELRRVCRGQLLMSIPFQEQEPISKGHLRRFEPADVLELFPDARLTILDRPRMPWMLIEERLDGEPFGPRVHPVPEADDIAEPSGRSTEPPATAASHDDDDRRIAVLEAELARLRARKSLRAANWVGAQLRRVRSAVSSLRTS